MKHPKKMTITLTFKEWNLIRYLCLDSWIAHNERKGDDTPNPSIYKKKELKRADKIMDKIEKEGELRNVEIWNSPYK